MFLCLLFVLFGLMTWLVLYPGPVIGGVLQLYNFSDMDFKLLLIAVAALNFLICFVVEVSDDMKIQYSHFGPLLIYIYMKNSCLNH